MIQSEPGRPQRPTHLSEYAEICLQALSDEGLGDRLSLGGAVGLLHYLDYRSTHDVDAWWASSTTEVERQQVVEIIERALRPFATVRKRAWGDVVSIELADDGQTKFSFQIAQRSVQLQSPVAVPWMHVLLDSFPDLVASKMVALVERGAPRDFRDIFALCRAGLTSPVQCWQWWKERQRLAGSDTGTDRARLAVETHLARIAQHRPLAQIESLDRRAEAEEVRTWFATEFLDALLA
jgi:hypothetical protein